MTLVEASEIIRNVALTASAPWAAAVAWRGLTTWKSETGWKKNSDLAEDLLVLMYKRRDAVSNIRHPAVFYNPIQADGEGNKIIDREISEFLGYADEYQKRVDKLEEIRAEIYAKRLRGDAMWGPEISRLLESVFKQEQKLIAAISAHLRARNPRMSHEQRAAAGGRYDLDLLYEDPDGEDDYRDEYQALFQPVEDYLRNKAKEYQ